MPCFSWLSRSFASSHSKRTGRRVRHWLTKSMTYVARRSPLGGGGCRPSPGPAGRPRAAGDLAPTGCRGVGSSGPNEGLARDGLEPPLRPVRGAGTDRSGPRCHRRQPPRPPENLQRLLPQLLLPAAVHRAAITFWRRSFGQRTRTARREARRRWRGSWGRSGASRRPGLRSRGAR